MRGPKGSNDHIRIVGAREHNLKNVTLNVPKKCLTVFTGVSGSGKSSLVFDTIAAESQRQLNETFSTFVRNRLPHYGQPQADALQNLTAAIIVDQKKLGGGARSTVGTVTDIGAMLRLLFSRIGKPFIGESTVFSFNNPEGMCPACEGLGIVRAVDLDKLVDTTKSLNQGAVTFPTFAVGTWHWKRLTTSGLFDNDKRLDDFTPEEWHLLMFAENLKLEDPGPGYPKSALYHGVVPRFVKAHLRMKEDQGPYQQVLSHVVSQGVCPDCGGSRLNARVRSCRIEQKNIADLSELSVYHLRTFLQGLSALSVHTVLASLDDNLSHLEQIGLGYLNLARPSSSLSGGESQRLKTVRHLGSSLSDMTYIFDEPSVGLHPRDVEQLNALLRQLRDKGNTVLVVEHDPQVIAVADHVVDMGPGAGLHGGEVVYQGDLNGLLAAATLTGKFMARQPALKTRPRTAIGKLEISNATLHNLKNVSVDLPMGVMTVVTGVAGSGKSSLINGVLPALHPHVVCIDQAQLRGSKRSNAATYTGILDDIRTLFARENGVSPKWFSANSQGACTSCRGLGTVSLDLAFMDSVAWPCETCGGTGFNAQALSYLWRGKTIHDVLHLTVQEAHEFFVQPAILAVLERLERVGLAYLTLGQPLNTLSGGERQRLKLASELENASHIYVFDEPTTGLHFSDVAHLLKLLNDLVDEGRTVIVIEHNLEVISQADWIIDMGPEAGEFGGQVIFEGSARALSEARATLTGQFLAQYLKSESL